MDTKRQQKTNSNTLIFSVYNLNESDSLMKHKHYEIGGVIVDTDKSKEIIKENADRLMRKQKKLTDFKYKKHYPQILL